MNAKKLACLLLIGAMLTSLTACGSTAEVDTAPTVSADTETETETEKRWLDDMPEDLDLQGATIRFLLEDGGNDNLTERSLVSDEEAEDVVIRRKCLWSVARRKPCQMHRCFKLSLGSCCRALQLLSYTDRSAGSSRPPQSLSPQVFCFTKAFPF